LLVVAILAIVRGLKSDPDRLPGWLQFVLFVSLIFGIGFSIGGPSLALLGIAQNAIPKLSAAKGFDDLETNEHVNWLIRLIPYDPVAEPYLAVSQLKKLGKESDKFSFVSPYEDLRGFTVEAAIKKVGGVFDPLNRVSAIIFQTPTPKESVLYPANARGMLQVIREIELDPTLNIDRPLLKGTGELTSPEEKELGVIDIGSWSYKHYSGSYTKYCELAHKFQCEKLSPFSARNYLGTISDDWHPLGFSQAKPRVDPCSRPVVDFCQSKEWAAWKESLLSQFGARAFLMKNLGLDSLRKRYLIDFGGPDSQNIPDIGVR
jgi:hypothetical protein